MSGIRRKPRRREAQLAFDALSIEGGLLSPEWLSKVAQLQAGTQTEPDYRIPKGLNLRDEIAKDGRQFAFAAGGETKGNARKTTGSYYTPDSLVQVLLDSALEPVIADTIAKNPGNAGEALLGLSIVDPACGSGHFLLAAARRLAAHVARLQANGTPSAAEYRHALRQVVGCCIFGVDLNPMAVELCKVGLWMEAVEPGLPLTFLNSHIQHGNALLGTTPELMAKGIPDAAWNPIDGDDKKTAGALKKRNKKAAEGQRSLDTLWTKPADTEAQTVTRAITELDAASDANVAALAKKEERWDGILGSPEYRHQKFVADAWCAAFVWPKQPGEFVDAAPTNELWRQLRDGQGKAPALTTKTVGELSDQYRFFHWHLQFPQVFAKGGFDVVLGNPPWIAHAGRAAQPLPPGVKRFYETNYEAFADYPTTHGLFASVIPTVIGTANMSLTSVAALSIPWAEVLRRATVEHLLEMDADGLWRAGADINDAPSDVFDSRALVALSWLEDSLDVLVAQRREANGMTESGVNILGGVALAQEQDAPSATAPVPGRPRAQASKELS